MDLRHKTSQRALPSKLFKRSQNQTVEPPQLVQWEAKTFLTLRLKLLTKEIRSHHLGSPSKVNSWSSTKVTSQLMQSTLKSSWQIDSKKPQTTKERRCRHSPKRSTKSLSGTRTSEVFCSRSSKLTMNISERPLKTFPLLSLLTLGNDHHTRILLSRSKRQKWS